MASTEQQNGAQEATFARDLGLFDATMIGIGAMIGAGIFVLTGIAAGEAGPASLLAFGLNGVVTLLTAFAYAELASTIPRAGGGYSFVRMAFPGGVGFVAGWMLWFAYTVACSLYALGFAGYFWEIFHKYIPGVTGSLFELFGHSAPILVVTFFVGIVFTVLNARGTEVTGKAENILTISKLVVLGIFVFFGVKAIYAEPTQSFENLTPFFPKGMGGVLIAMGLTFIAFEGYDLIATVAEEIKDPERNIPRATFISLGVTVTLYLLILLVALAAVQGDGLPTWQFLGKYKETAIVRAAEDFMPAVGVAIIVIGGLLSTMSALNATVMAASRVAFSMGRDSWLPTAMSKLHPTRRTPQVAIIVTGVILLAMASTLPIETVGSAASLMFLLTFALVNLSVIALRRRHPELPRRYKMPFYPAVPVLGFFLNIFLAVYQFNFQPIAWYVTAGWIAFGLLIYYAIFEKRSRHLEPQVLLPRAPAADAPSSKPLLVALHNPDNVRLLLDIAFPIAKRRDVPITVVTIVEVPRQMPIHEGVRFAHHKQPLLVEAKKLAAGRGVKIDTDLVIAHNAADGILAAVERHQASALVMGWKGYTNARDRIFGEVADKIIRFVPCDLMLLKIGANHDIENCMLPTAGGPNAMLASQVLSAIATERDMTVTGVYVVPEGASGEQRDNGRGWLDRTLERLDAAVHSEWRLVESPSIAGGIAKASSDYDLVVIGAAKEPFFRKMLFGEIPERVARYSRTSVLVVKQYEGVIKSILKRILG